MKVSRRDALKIAAAVPTLGAAKAPPSLPPIVTSGGVRLYPSWDSTQWWTSEPVSGWDLPQSVSLGASLAPDGATAFQDTRNTPLHGLFTRAYFQFSTRPLNGAQSLDGVFSAAFHAIEWHKRIDALLAIQSSCTAPIRRSEASRCRSRQIRSSSRWEIHPGAAPHRIGRWRRWRVKTAT